MKFTIDRSVLLPVLELVVPVATRNTTMPILEQVMLSVTGRGLLVSANNLETAITIDVPCESFVSSGLTCAPGKRLLDVVKASPAGLLSFSLSDSGRLKVDAGSASFSVSCLDTADWPELPAAPQTKALPYYESGPIADALERVAFAASTDDSRFNLNAVHIEPVEDSIRLTSTDGHRLARATLPRSFHFPERQSALLPRTVVGHLVKLLRSSSENVFLTMDAKNLFVVCDGLSASFRLVDGEFPDADRVIPQTLSVAIEVSRKPLLDAIGRANLFTDERSSGIFVAVEDGKISVASQNSDTGESQDSVPVDYHDEPVTWIVNGSYFAEALKHVGTESVRLELVDHLMDGTPFLVKPVEEDGYFSLVMPMRK